MSSETAISFEENAGQLHDRLKDLGSKTVIETLKLVEKGNVSTTIQKDTAEIKTAYKLDKDNCKIDWNKPTVEIYNLIRGLSPYPSAWCYFKDGQNEWNVKIYDAKMTVESHSYEIGKIITSKKTIKAATKDGFIAILSLQFPGKKKMLTSELLNGITFNENAIVC